MPDTAVRTERLTRVFKPKRSERKTERMLVALDRVDMEIPRGELFGLLGPNGAGKTTLIRILTTLLAPTSGRAWVAGVDVAENPWEVRRHINVVSGGESSGYGLLTVEENLWMFTQFYGMDSKTARRRIAEMLEVVGLADRAKTKIYHLSTGMRQKMNFVRGFLTDPEILFLDEPTLGLDVQTARVLRGYIKDWIRARPRGAPSPPLGERVGVRGGSDRAILLTTHYMHEADELCDRVAIIDQGRIMACDTPRGLKRRLQAATVFRLQVQSPRDPATLLSEVQGIDRFAHADRNGHVELDLILKDENVLVPVLAALQRADAHLLSLEKREPSLEDVFVSLVGRTLTEDTSEAPTSD